VGSAQAYRHFVGQIAARARAPAFVADFGLAPERPFPAAVDDADAAYRGLAAAGFSKMSIAGDSAGGRAGLRFSSANGAGRVGRCGVMPGSRHRDVPVDRSGSDRRQHRGASEARSAVDSRNAGECPAFLSRADGCQRPPRVAAIW
jgi:hypothetical protein